MAQRATRSTLAVGEVPAGALVGERRVDVAVGDHHGTAGQCRRDDALDVLGLVGGVEQRLGAVGERAGGRVEHDLAQLLADLGVAGLVGEQHVVPLLGEPAEQQPGLGRLAGTLAALERDEEAPGRVDARGC